MEIDMLGGSRYDIKRGSYGGLVVSKDVNVSNVVFCRIRDGGFQCSIDGGGFRIVDFHAWAQGFGALEDVM